MINLGEGIEEIAVERTTKKVTKEVTEGFIMSMYNIGYTLAQISEVTNLDVEDIKAIVDKKVFN